MEKLLQERLAEINNMRSLWKHVQELDETVGLKVDTISELQAKISSRIALCERSIIDNSKGMWSDEKVNQLNEGQKDTSRHPYTCDRSSVSCQVRVNDGDGVLIATNGGWVCPCGNYRQFWSY